MILAIEFHWWYFSNTFIGIYLLGCFAVWMVTRTKDFKEGMKHYREEKENTPLSTGIFIMGSWFTIWIGKPAIMKMMNDYAVAKRTVKEFRKDMQRRIATEENNETKERLQKQLEEFETKLKQHGS